MVEFFAYAVVALIVFFFIIIIVSGLIMALALAGLIIMAILEWVVSLFRKNQ